MLHNYFKIALRNLWRHKGISIINVLGLAIGLTCFITIGMYVLDELSYDKYNKFSDRIFRINSDIRFGGTDLIMAVSADPMGATLKKDYPQVEEFTRIYNSEGAKLIKKGTEFINEARVTYVDSTFFSVFTLPAIAGDARTALNEPNTVVVTESTAKKYFGTTDILGKPIETNDGGQNIFKVTAVIKDVPLNSHFNFDFFFSMDNVEYGFGNFLSHNFHTYLLLKEGADYKDFTKIFAEVIDKYIIPQAKAFMNIESIKDFEKSGNKLAYSLIPVTDIHLKSARGVELNPNGNIQYVYIFSAVAFFILLIACINFMNLSTASSGGRAKEIGIRKVLGTEKKSLLGQFLVESTLMSYIAMAIAILLTWIGISWFNELSGKQLTLLTYSGQPIYLLLLILLPIPIGFLSGIYPAFFLSSFQPIVVLKGKMPSGFKKSNLRSLLVVFQFCASIILIFGTIIIYRQLNFIQTTKIGFNKDQVIVVDNSGMPSQNRLVFNEEISKLSGVQSASFAGYLPVSNSSRSDNTWSTEAVMNEQNGFNMQNWNIDYNYISTLGMEMVSGRNFSKEFGSDSSAIIINEKAASLLGAENPVGKILYSSDRDGKPAARTIIGVVKNFNFESLRKNIGPLCFQLGNNRWASAFKVNGSEAPALVKNIESSFKKWAPGMPFSYQFLDESFDAMYREEQRVGNVALTFSLLAIFIACLGLFGLTTFIAERRTKEIGIRKVLGANVSGIMTMLSKDFVKLVAIAALIAFPFGYYLMNNWLHDYENRISLQWWMFAFAGGVTIIIALLTVSIQAIKSALANPIKSLRTE